MTENEAIVLASGAEMPRVAQCRPVSPTCRKCGGAKKSYRRAKGGRELVCLACRKADRAAKITTADGVPLCAKCHEPKSKQRSSCSHKGFRWFCYPCHEDGRRASREIENEEAPIIVPPRPEPRAPTAKRERPRFYADIREYWACERRWKRPVKNPTEAKRHGCFDRREK